MKKEKKSSRQSQPFLPAAQSELDQKVQRCTRSAYHAEAYAIMELVARGMKKQAVRAVAEQAEALAIIGFNRFEDFFESLGISRRTGFNWKKIAETFSEEEVQLLHSAGFSNRGILKLASLPPGQLPDLKNIDDPEELKATIEGLISENKTLREVGTKVGAEYEALQKENKTLKSRLPNQHGLEWALLAIMRADNCIAGFQSEMDLLLDSKDHRLVRDPAFKARIIGLFEAFYRMTIEVSYKIEELTGYNPCNFYHSTIKGVSDE